MDEVLAARMASGNAVCPHCSQVVRQVNAQVQENMQNRGTELAKAVLAWARSGVPHGGNPYMLDFVDIAREMLGDK
jgi:hypothetical protein